MSQIPVYPKGTHRNDAISRQAAKLLVKQGRGRWIDPTERSQGVLLLPEGLKTDETDNGEIYLINGVPAPPLRRTDLRDISNGRARGSFESGKRR